MSGFFYIHLCSVFVNINHAVEAMNIIDEGGYSSRVAALFTEKYKQTKLN